ncbi:MAG: DUF4180 domain-containing protein [Firmicutes bacterium]|nr:DUF4180 domain-containing protein [Bacillota bacterium]
MRWTCVGAARISIVRKCTSCRVRLGLVGRFSRDPSPSLQAFIGERKRGRHVYFAASLDKALHFLVAE